MPTLTRLPRSLSTTPCLYIFAEQQGYTPWVGTWHGISVCLTHRHGRLSSSILKHFATISASPSQAGTSRASQQVYNTSSDSEVKSDSSTHSVRPAVLAYLESCRAYRAASFRNRGQCSAIFNKGNPIKRYDHSPHHPPSPPPSPSPPTTFASYSIFVFSLLTFFASTMLVQDFFKLIWTFLVATLDSFISPWYFAVTPFSVPTRMRFQRHAKLPSGLVLCDMIQAPQYDRPA